MYLKQLELHGFKSFADKTVIDLDPGIVGVVGPNGSGKSNIVEAVRWVLGEQSARAIRGRKMEDVIFGGTKKRKPLGLAEVSIVLDNSDYTLPLEFTEVKVTRRLYRSGEGEYLINNKYCRLKDVRRLFDDSGICSDGYAIIGQGRITELLGAKPEERRSMVEETAGVVKYRERKKEAQRKIDAADRNLDRLDDIMVEIESRLRPLQRDSENAQKYLVYKKELDGISIALLAADGLAGQERLRALNNQEQAEQGTHEQLRGALLAAETKLNEQRLQFSALRDECDTQRQSLHRAETDIKAVEGEIKSLSARVRGYDEMSALLRSELDELTVKLKDADQSIVAEEARSQLSASELEAIAARLTEVEDRRRSEEADLLRAEEQVNALREEAFECARTGIAKKNELQEASRRREDHCRRLAAIAEKLNSYDEQDEVLQARIAEISDFIDDVATREDELGSRLRELKVTSDELKNAIIAKREAVVAAKMRASSLEARVRTLEELVLKREGLYPGVKSVLEAKGKSQLSGIVGVVAELIKVDRGYSVAIESVLGSGIQNIVAETGEAASAAVAWLKTNRRGIATFLPLDMLRTEEERTIPAKIENHSAFLGKATQHVSGPLKAMPAIQYLLHNTLIFQDLEDAIKLAREFKGRFRFVTIEGDVINTGGAVSGGSRDKRRGGLLSRQAEIEDLRREIGNCGRNEKSLQDEIEDLNDRRDNSKNAQSATERKLRDLQDEKQSYDGEIRNIDTKREIYQREKDALVEERTLLNAEIDRDSGFIKELENEINRITEDEDAMTHQVTELEDSFRHAKQSESKSRDEHAEVRVEYAARRTEAENDRCRVEKLRVERAEIAAALADKTVEWNRAAADRTASLNRKAELLSIALNNRRALARDTLVLAEKDEAYRLLDADVIGLEQDLKKLRRDEETAREAVHRTAVQKERLSLEQEQIEERLREEFQLSLDEALPCCREGLTRTAARDNVKTLKKQIEALGTINLSAIEEYAAVAERYEFLSDQRGDIASARESLEGVIARMDEIIVEKFRDTFNQLNKSFQETFPGFFQGGYGELRLTDPNDLLTTGVEVIVQPPGKRLQHHGLLSGGEKSLSGIALLFAVLKVKPSPFYVLDEIDAALDDVNVRKFASYLMRHGEESQFLVITHRQGTMEASRELYGVTMAEGGVSQTVSVKLVG